MKNYSVDSPSYILVQCGNIISLYNDQDIEDLVNSCSVDELYTIFDILNVMNVDWKLNYSEGLSTFINLFNKKVYE